MKRKRKKEIDEIEILKWEFLYLAKTWLCLVYFERLKRKIHNGMTSSTRTKRTA